MVRNSRRKQRQQLERDIEHVTAEMYRRNKELAETNKTLSLLRIIDALVLESHAPVTMVCEHIAAAITQATDYSFVGLFTRSGRGHYAVHAKEGPAHTDDKDDIGDQDELTLFGWSGQSLLGTDLPIKFRHPPRLLLANPWLQQSQRSDLIALDAMATSEIAEAVGSSEADIAQLIELTSIRSLYTVRLFVRHRLVGVLAVGFSTPAADISQADKLLIDRLSENVGVALDNKLLFEENRHVLYQLRQSNTKLKALDAAKDDFISMASHQLRTPLTSVKGYLSLVLDGDAGHVTAGQKKLLEQSFFSAQRMVYLIADLLNVSRLGTGKFVIEKTPVDLARVVGEEVEQLRKIAASHQLSLKYDRPERLPELSLDETKTRQVIMNFIDNALYYTPSGGHIVVRLVDKPDSVELRVTDDGIGVPRADQPHLFTKFYRAGNARKTRPDGTGLGLFMAKKVVVAQGGALIFDSRENHGSTFGFTFRKRDLALPPPAKPASK